MEGFTLVDGGVALIILISAILAYSRGFVREALAVAGWIAAAVLAYIFAPSAEPLMREIPGVSKVLDNCTASTIAAFAGVFALALIVFALFTPVFSSVVQRSAFNAIDQGLGFLFGALRGMLIVVIAFVIYDFAMGGQGVATVDNSRSANVFASMKDSLTSQISDQETTLAWLTDKFETLIDKSCGGASEPATPADSAG
ncbi:CvpA family protein [Tropicimonas sp.]|uniref:CvpA family protein n=1 Tax=Tropicimonas sp. TaxID=2067044 RepID=UPI003A8AF96E